MRGLGPQILILTCAAARQPRGATNEAEKIRERDAQQHLAAQLEVDGGVDGHADRSGHHAQRQQPHHDGSVRVVAAPVLVPVPRHACAGAILSIDSALQMVGVSVGCFQVQERMSKRMGNLAAAVQQGVEIAVETALRRPVIRLC